MIRKVEFTEGWSDDRLSYIRTLFMPCRTGELVNGKVINIRVEPVTLEIIPVIRLFLS